MERAAFPLLHQRLTASGFDAWDAVTEEDVYAGAPHCYAEFMRAILTSFPRETAALMRKHPWLCVEGEDGALAAAVLRLLSLEGGRRNSIKSTQFREKKYAAAKINLCIELFDLLDRLAASSGGTRSPGAAERKVGAAKTGPSCPPARDAPALLLNARLADVHGRKRALDHLVRK
ncbi:uncharacterized protein Tco025E_08600 [Trypanosoma conorhini]|uniref:Centrosomal protein of 44 kDa n=1 Tax=Trypanosoma conorhini TaxID=83891 RepID=A0A422N8M9_9TRYP|nr:uncharacterized protein Tco025E_08600 [Trypanosoma conorhini]RNF01815.1 hypothetical protein Tco025E_08600 [Trypanosoma conorhini]